MVLRQVISLPYTGTTELDLTHRFHTQESIPQIPHTGIKSRWFKDKCEREVRKISEDNIGEYFYKPRVRNHFLNTHTQGPIKGHIQPH